MFKKLFISLAMYSWLCGATPASPPGCDRAICVCDTDQKNCRWEWICE